MKYIEEIMMVSGLSASGKSTFIEQFLSGNLNGELRYNLPSAAHHWFQLGEGCRLLVGPNIEAELQNVPADVSRIIVHYDAMQIHRLGLEDYDVDPIFNVLRSANYCTLVVLNPSPSRIMDQFNKRRDLHLSRKRFASRAWAKYVRIPLRDTLRNWLPPSRYPTVRQLYSSPTAVESYCRAWLRFVHRISVQNSNIKVVYVEPDVRSDMSPGFLLSSNPRLGDETERV